ncbi:MAG: hypothetical protein ACXWQO_02870 [Bdellovibrionota bacterium]
MKNHYWKVLPFICFLAAVAAQAEESYDKYDKFEANASNLEDLNYHLPTMAAKSLKFHGSECLPNWAEKYDEQVNSETSTTITAITQAYDKSSLEYSYSRANQPFIGALTGGSKSTKYMCEQGYDHLIEEYRFKVEHYVESLSTIEDQAHKLSKAYDDHKKLFDRKLVQKDFSKGSCFFRTDLDDAEKNIAGYMNYSKGTIEELIPGFKDRLVEATKEMVAAREEKLATCDGKKVKKGVKENGGYANEFEYPQDQPDQNHSSAE